MGKLLSGPFCILTLACFEVFRIPKSLDTLVFKCKNKWFMAT